MSCNICCENFKTNRPKICCQYCDFDACRACCEKYILSEEIPKCMMPGCGKEWSRKFIKEKFTNSFLTSDYKEHLETILFDKEKALLPATQPLVEEKIRKQNIKKEIRNINNLIEELLKQKRNLELGLYNRTNSQEKTDESSHRFVRQCPADGCRGFLSTQWKCGLCENWTCPDCHELKGPKRDCEHTCDPNSVETAKLLSKDSKPCPKCQSLIFKIEGCFAENTPILMWDGTHKMSQDIRLGDILVGDDGEKRVVEDLVSGEDELYEVKQNTATNYTVNSKHMLALKFSSDNAISWFESINSWKVYWFDIISQKTRTKQFKITENCNKETCYHQACEFLKSLKLDDIILLTVDDYLKLDKNTKKILYGFKTANGINFEEVDISLDPYLLGLWLGDGTHTEPIIASNDIEIQNYISQWCENNNAELVQESKYKLRIRRRGYSFGKETITGDKYKSIPDTSDRTNPFTNQLTKYNLIGNKHIPNEYFMNSREVRLKLLAGLIDTDGHVPKDQYGKRAVILQTRDTLSKQIIKLARSLGFIVNYTIRKRKNIKIFDSEPKDYKDLYVINISGEKLSEIPTILHRKQCCDSKPNKDYLKTSIEVIHSGRGKYYGWTVNGNNRFLLDDFTVVKNCDQMWCTQCRTAFSWKTGNLESHIHNPHYYEWMRKNNGGVVPRTHGDVPPAHPAEIRCGQELSQHISQQIMNLARKHGLSISPSDGRNIRREFDCVIYTIYEIIHNIIHNARVELPTFQTDHFERNQELRIRYLEGQINEEEFKILIQRADKKNRKNIEISQIITLCNTAVTDIIHRFYDYLKNYKPNMVNKPNFEPFIQEIKQIRDYCNNILREIAFTYNCVEYIFVEYFHFEKVINIKCVNEKPRKKESVHKESVHKESVHKESVHKESVHKEALEVEEKNVILPKKASKSKNILLVIDDDDDENIVLSKKT